MKRLSIVQVILVVLLASCMTGGMEKPRIRNAIKYNAMAKSMVEGERSIDGKLSIQPSTEGGYITASILLPGSHIEAKWPEWASKVPVIDPLQDYHIELLTRIYREPDYVFNDILRVSKNNQVILDASICHIHQIAMQRQIENGVSAEDYPDSFFVIQQKSFPNDGNAYLACGSGISHPTWKCAKCRAEFDLWEKKHGLK